MLSKSNLTMLSKSTINDKYCIYIAQRRPLCNKYNFSQGWQLMFMIISRDKETGEDLHKILM